MFADDVWRYSPIGPVPTLIAGIIGLGLVVYVTWVRSTRTRAITWALLGVCVLVILTMTGRGAVLGADAVLVVASEYEGRGMFVEFGAALARAERGDLRHVVVIGPIRHESVFYYHPAVQLCSTVDEWLATLS